MKNHRILVASPVRQQEQILREFLASLEGLERAGLDLDFAFVDDYNNHNLLPQFAAGKSNVQILPGMPSSPYVCTEHTHHWREDLIWKVAEYKDRLIKLARDGAYDYLFLADSDLYLHPQTLTHLVSLGKDIVSEVYWTKWEPHLPPLPQVWVGGQYRLHHIGREEGISEAEAAKRTEQFLAMLSAPGIYRVGGLGACTLISANALARGVSFQEIYNLDLIGEDRHFCVRAAALGLELYADTHHPPFHIYRVSELAALEEYKKKLGILPQQTILGAKPGVNAKLTLGMLVRNEANRYLRQVLTQACAYVDEVVILDDASQDNTVEVCRETVKNIPLTVVSNHTPGFHDEITLRKQLWEAVIETNPEWILILDADEMFEDNATSTLRQLLENTEHYHWSFRLYDMWDEQHYREDRFWQAHQFYRPFIVKYLPNFDYVWRETPLHCGRFPASIVNLKGGLADLRIKHLGWMKPADRLNKYQRYKKLDPKGVYGIKEQYDSILDPRPHLVRWV